MITRRRRSVLVWLAAAIALAGVVNVRGVVKFAEAPPSQLAGFAVRR